MISRGLRWIRADFLSSTLLRWTTAESLSSTLLRVTIVYYWFFFSDSQWFRYLIIVIFLSHSFYEAILEFACLDLFKLLDILTSLFLFHID